MTGKVTRLEILKLLCERNLWAPWAILVLVKIMFWPILRRPAIIKNLLPQRNCRAVMGCCSCCTGISFCSSREKWIGQGFSKHYAREAEGDFMSISGMYYNIDLANFATVQTSNYGMKWLKLNRYLNVLMQRSKYTRVIKKVHFQFTQEHKSERNSLFFVFIFQNIVLFFLNKWSPSSWASRQCRINKLPDVANATFWPALWGAQWRYWLPRETTRTFPKYVQYILGPTDSLSPLFDNKSLYR